MKLNEITAVAEGLTPTERQDILNQVIDMNQVVTSNRDIMYDMYDVDSNGVVDVNGDFELSEDFKNIKKLPIKFGEVSGKFSVLNAYRLTTFENFPTHCEKLNIVKTGITSLVGIADKISMKELYLSCPTIKEGGLGLLTIPSLLSMTVFSETTPFEIISKYIGKPDKIFECQQELIEAGFDKYAEL